MQLIEPTPTPENFPHHRGSPQVDVSVRWDPSVFTLSPAKSNFHSGHDDTLLPAALEEVERIRLGLEELLDQDLFKLCL